jgi:hypothetical protein
MATLPEFLTRYQAPMGAEAPVERKQDRKPEWDPFQLRALPFEDVYFRPKKMDNSKLIRQADPRAGGACWTVIGAACLMLAFLGGVLAPSVANTVAGYKLESLRVEAGKLANERRTLELQEAVLLSPERLDKLARGQHLVSPTASQIFRLDNTGEGKVAMVAVNDGSKRRQ